jgi:hypothetical protein
VVFHPRLVDAHEPAGAEEWDEGLTEDELAAREPVTRIPDYAFRFDGATRAEPPVRARPPFRYKQGAGCSSPSPPISAKGVETIEAGAVDCRGGHLCQVDSECVVEFREARLFAAPECHRPE